jgi:MFS superfamily sulfate permease-like transporter
MELRLTGAATFLKVPALTQALGSVPPGTTLHVPLGNLSYIDHACLELLEEWGRANAAQGSRLLLEQRSAQAQGRGADSYVDWWGGVALITCYRHGNL